MSLVCKGMCSFPFQGALVRGKEQDTSSKVPRSRFSCVFSLLWFVCIRQVRDVLFLLLGLCNISLKWSDPSVFHKDRCYEIIPGVLGSKIGNSQPLKLMKAFSMASWRPPAGSQLMANSSE